jgi:peptidoglycan-N-acetylglucosamine deacetylase
MYTPTPRWPVPTEKRPGRGRRWSRTGLIALAVIALILASGSAVLAAMGSLPLPSWLFVTRSTAVHSWPTATLIPTATMAPTMTPTVALTPTPTQNPLVTGGIDLGCGPTPTHPASHVVWVGPGAFNEVALTFDDGPSPDRTETMLTTLEQTHTPATFFVVGASAHTRPNLIAREAADGFAIGIHTWDHPFMTKLTPAQRAWELASTAQAIHADLGPHYCLRYWRPPFGDYNSQVVAQTQAMGLTTVTWSVDPRDWSDPGVSVIVQRVLSAARPGSIILLHDGYFNRNETAQALPQIIQGLRARGLVPVTLPQLLAGAPPATLTPTSVP